VKTIRWSVPRYFAGLCAFLATLSFALPATAQDVTFSPASLSWASVQIGQTSGIKSFTVTNTQSISLTIASISIPTGSDFIISSSTCPISPSTVAAGASCTISVQFRPLAQGTRTNAVKLVDDAPSQTQTLPLSGTGTTGAILFSPTSLSFSNVPVGTTSTPQSVTLANTLSTDITLSNIKIGSGVFTQTNNCPLSPNVLAAGTTCTFSVTYRPTAAGSSASAITVTDTSGTVTASTQLYLFGSTPSVTLSPASKDFGSVQVGASSANQSFTLLNNYAQAITISSIATGLTDYSATSNCPMSPSTLASASSCTIQVAFSPTATGARVDQLTVTHDAPGSPTTSSLTGTGTAVPSGITFSPTSLSWGNTSVGQGSTSKVVTLANSSGAALTIASIAVGSDYVINSKTCPLSPSTLANGSSCTITVSFRPLAQGLRSDVITVTDDNASSPQLLPISGTGVIGAALFSPTSLSFPSTVVGSSSAVQTATFTNEQATSLSISSIATTASFTQSNDCPATLAAGASCNFSLTFAPVSTGTISGTANVNYGSGILSLYLSGTATSSGGGGSVSVSPKLYSFPNQAVGSSSSPVNVTLTNNQSGALAISSIMASAPFSETDNCGTSLAAGKNCSISVSFSPSTTGFFSSNLTITDNGAGSPRTVALSGNGVIPITVVPKAGGLYFYNQIVNTPSTPQPVTITNNQSIPLAISSLTTSVDYPFTTDCVDNTGTGTLAASATCTVQITFLPQSASSRPSALVITDDAPGSPLNVPIQGTGIAGSPGPTVIVSPYLPCIMPSQTMQFSVLFTGMNSTNVLWYVDNVLNGNANAGTISSSGLYSAPATAATHVIKAVSQGTTKYSGSTTVTLTATPQFGIYPYVAAIPPNGQQTFQAQLCAVPDTGTVTFTVDNIPGGNATVGTVTSNGVYTAPAVAGKHTVRATDAVVGKTSGGVVTVFSSLTADYGSRVDTTHPIPADMFGTGRGESMHSTADRNLLTQAGLTVTRLYAQIPLVYATQTPDWTKIDPLITSIQAAGQHPMIQMSLTPLWLQPSPNTLCGTGNTMTAPTDVNKWAQIAASYVAHFDAVFPGFVRDYEIWNEPNATGLCASDHLKTYLAIYAAAAPLMKQQAATDGQTIRVGGPVLSGYSALWFSNLLTNPGTAPYVDFISYHQYIFGSNALQAQWDGYNGNDSLYEMTQDPSNGPVGVYNKVVGQAKAGSQPLGANTPIYITEFNTNWAFFKDCCRNDATYAPIWNSMYVADILNSVYTGTVNLPAKMYYFAGSAYPWFCMVGVQNANMDCLYSAGSTPAPYPQYYAFQLIAGSNYLGLWTGGYMAKSVSPPSGGGGLIVTAFYNASQDAMLIVNPTATNYTGIPLSFQNTGFASPNATLYQIVNGSTINSSSVALTAAGSGYTTTISIPAYSVQAVSLKGQ
jgi:Glycosyl hydrolases family 39